jgi:hypothetical protein
MRALALKVVDVSNYNMILTITFVRHFRDEGPLHQ